MPDSKKPATRRRAGEQPAEGLSPEEIAALKETMAERKAAARRGAKGDGEQDVLAKIAEMPDSDRAMAERFHAIVKANAPGLSPRTWYGMPAYADGEGKIVCFFQAAAKFKARYATLGFDAAAHLDEGSMWPTSWAITQLTAADEARIAELVRRAVG